MNPWEKFAYLALAAFLSMVVTGILVVVFSEGRAVILFPVFMFAIYQGFYYGPY